MTGRRLNTLKVAFGRFEAFARPSCGSATPTDGCAAKRCEPRAI